MNVRPGLWPLCVMGNSHNCRGKECGPFPIMCFVFIYICVYFPVWGHLSLNSWKQAVYSGAQAKTH